MKIFNKVSVIIPIYKTPILHFVKCIQSVIHQTYENLEIICIIDGFDKTYSEYLENLKDNRIKILINDKNMGVSYSRNRGIEESTGDYIHFLDSDDYISDNCYEEAVKEFKKRNVNSIMLQFCGIDKYGTIEIDIRNSLCPSTFTPDFVLYLPPIVWDKVYNGKYLRENKDIRFPVGLIYEDAYFFWVWCLKSQTTYKLDGTFQYFHHGDVKNSIMTTTIAGNNKHIYDLLIIDFKIFKFVLKYYKKYLISYLKFFKVQFLLFISMLIRRINYKLGIKNGSKLR